MPLVELSTAAPRIRILTLNEPETRNAISFDLTAELYQALEALHKDNDCSVVVLTGASGASLIADDLLLVRLLAEDGFALRAQMIPVMTALADVPVPRVWRL